MKAVIIELSSAPHYMNPTQIYDDLKAKGLTQLTTRKYGINMVKRLRAELICEGLLQLEMTNDASIQSVSLINDDFQTGVIFRI